MAKTESKTTESARFFDALVTRYESGTAQAFILHLNTRDYVAPGVRLPQYLASRLASRDIVATYDRASGIGFATPSMRSLALSVLGLDKAQAPDPLLALVNPNAAPSTSGDVELPRSPSAALPLLSRLLSSNKRTVVIIDALETVAPAADVAAMSPDDRDALVALTAWGTDKRIESAGGLVVALAENIASVSSTLRSASSGWVAIDVPLPDESARRSFAAWYAEQESRVSFDTLTLDDFARATAGLSLVGVENVLLSALYTGAALTLDMVRDEKRALIAQEYAGLLDIVEPRGGFETVGGMSALKTWARENVIAPLKAGATDDAPKGVLLVGPPGTGKTFFVSALARECGYNVVSLSMENIQQGLVGASERNLARVFQVVKSLSPCICFIDEIDQSDIGARGNGSGNPVAKNLFSMLLRFMGEPSNRGKVVFFLASNRPDLLDSALMRFGRIDAIVPVLLPDDDERAAIVKAQAKSQGARISDDAVASIVSTSENYSAADLSAVVSKARKVARASGLKSIDVASAQRASATIRPTTVARAEYYTLLAVEACNDSELLPARYSKLLNNRAALDEQVETVAPPSARGKRSL